MKRAASIPAVCAVALFQLAALVSVSSAYSTNCMLCVWRATNADGLEECSSRSSDLWSQRCHDLTKSSCACAASPCQPFSCPVPRGLSTDCTICVWNVWNAMGALGPLCSARSEESWDSSCYVLADTDPNCRVLCSSTREPTQPPTYASRFSQAPTMVPSCTAPANVANAVADCNSQSCSWTCNSGFSLVGTASATCLPGGTWSSRPPKCIPSCQVTTKEGTWLTRGGVEIQIAGVKAYLTNIGAAPGCLYRSSNGVFAIFYKSGTLVTDRIMMTLNDGVSGSVSTAIVLSYMSVTVTSQLGITAREIPFKSCLARTCIYNNWENGAPISDTDFKQCNPNPAEYVPEMCYCDDACTQYKDCCSDYQETCVLPEVTRRNENLLSYLGDSSAVVLSEGSCQAVDKASLANVGGVELRIDGGTPTYLRSIPPSGCSFRGIFFATYQAPNTISRITMSVNAGATTVLTFMAITVTVRGQTVSARELPAQNCVSKGCLYVQWEDGEQITQNPASYKQCNPQPAPFVMNTCYCDDACTQYKDCCGDYQETCLLPKATKSGDYAGIVYMGQIS